MSTPTPRDLAEQFYKAAAAGDGATIMGLLDEQVVINEPAMLRYGGRYQGHQGFAQLSQKMAEAIPSASVQCTGLVAEGDTVFAMVELSSSATEGNSVLAERMTFRDGKIVELIVFVHDAAPSALRSS